MLPTANDFVPYDALLLVRGMRAELADETIANAVAIEGPWRNRSGGYHPGEGICHRMVDGLGQRDLQALADGPIMDGNRLYLPAGMLSRAETRAREQRNLNPQGASA